MPANLTADYLSAEQAYKHAETPAEKIAALEQMLATLPKHKGTEKLQADIRRRLSQARKDSQKRGVAQAAPIYLIKREGAGQVVLVGPPNSGKSQLICALTHARPEVAEYPFTTQIPVAGMMPYEDVQIQLVDSPAISPEHRAPWMNQLLRNGNLAALVIDPNDAGVLSDIDFVAGCFEEWHIKIPPILVANKMDLPGASENFELLRNLYSGRFDFIGVSAAEGAGLAAFAAAAFRALEVVRFYSKPPGKKAELDRPYILHRGETVLDAAAKVHRDFMEHLKYARLFHVGHEHDGMMVDRAHVVEDREIFEFHTV
jgi:ribosome-interacting GTPase 1